MLLHRLIHPTWLIATECLGVVAGVIAAQYVDQTIFGSVSWLLVAVLLTGLSMWQRRAWVFSLIFIAGCLLGLWRGSLVQSDLAPYKKLEGITLHVQGVVSEDTELDKRGDLVVRLDNIVINGHGLPSSIWVTTKSQMAIQRSDRVKFHGRLEEGFGNFGATMYNAKLEHIEHPVAPDVGLGVRDWFADAVRKVIPEPDASLGIGYLLGQRRGLPNDLENALKVAGLTHIIVASGYNLTILVRLARRLFERISKYLAALSGFVMIAGFIAITGMSPSMSRAGLVSGLALLAWYYGRKFHPIILLCLVAAITLLVNPSYGWNDLGWQLSFAAFGGVMILAPLLQAYFFGDKKPGILRQILGETLSAQLATLPILVFAFGQFSNLALFTNLLILPLVPIAMILTTLAGIGLLIVPNIAHIIAFPATTLLDYMVGVAHYFGGLSWAQTRIDIAWYWALGFYLALVGACMYMYHRTKLRLGEQSVVE